MFLLNRNNMVNCIIAELLYISYRLYIHFCPHHIAELVGIENAGMFINTIPEIVFFFLFLLIFHRNVGENTVEIKNNPKKHFKQMVMCVILTDILSAVYVTLFLENGAEKSENQEYIEVLLNDNFLLMSVACSIAAPFVEEIVYRGLLQGFLIGKSNNRIYLMLTAVVSGVIFGLAHCDFAPEKIITIFPNIITGVMIGILYINTKNIVCTSLVHIFYNCRSTLVFVLFQSLN